MRSIKLTLAYDGTAYAGWQVQADKTTVQSAFESALEKVIGESIRVLASGRTDAGVHALGQVVGLRTDTHLANDVLQRALNAVLPRDMAVLDVADAPDDFHPIRDAIKKRYRYVIHDGPVRDVFRRDYCWQCRERLDDHAMHEAAQTLLGTHDFSSFESTGAPRATSIRTISDVFVRRDGGASGPGNLVVIEVEADGFLYNMVRAIVGTLVEVGRGAEDAAWVKRVLAAANRSVAGPTAPPQGLFLVRVEYPESSSGQRG